MFEIKAMFKIPEYCQIVSKERNFEFNICDQLFQFRGYKDDVAISDNNIFIMSSGKYPQQEFAKDDSALLNYALMLTALELGIGISYDDYCMVNFFYKPLKDFFNKNFASGDICAKRDFGLSVCEENVEPFDMNFDYKKECTIEEIEEIFTEYYGKLLIQDEKMMSALLLANSIMFQASFIARILLCMTVIEMLAEKEKRCDEEIKLIDRMVILIKESSLAEEKRAPLLSCISDLRNKSISKRCQSLIEKHLGAEKGKIFKELYGMRSKYVHEGTQFKDAYKEADMAFRLVHDLLFEIIKKSQHKH